MADEKQTPLLIGSYKTPLGIGLYTRPLKDLEAPEILCETEELARMVLSSVNASPLVDELADAAPRISTDGDGDVWMHGPNVGINLSAQAGPVIRKNLLAWAERMKRALDAYQKAMEF